MTPDLPFIPTVVIAGIALWAILRSLHNRSGCLRTLAVLALIIAAAALYASTTPAGKFFVWLFL